MIHASLMYLCRLSISWKVENHSRGGRLLMNEKRMPPNNVKRSKEIPGSDMKQMEQSLSAALDPPSA